VRSNCPWNSSERSLKNTALVLPIDQRRVVAIAIVSPRTSVAFREILWEPLTESLGTSNARLPQEEEKGDPICDKNRFCMYTSREYESAEDERLSHASSSASRRVVGHRYLAMRFLPNARIFSPTRADPRIMDAASFFPLLPSYPVARVFEG